MTSSFQRELECARLLVDELGPIACDIQRGGVGAMQTVEKPDDGGPVTQADLLLNRRIVSTLRAAFPDDGIVAEESDDHEERLSRERCWYIDPIDGTTDYSRGLDTWAIHIGLCVGNQPVFGMVAQPAVGRVTWGFCTGEEKAAFTELRGQPAQRLRLQSHTGPLRLLSSRNHPRPETLLVLDALKIEPANHLRIGSTGVKISTLARGDAEIYLHPSGRTKLWDSCAPQAILEAAGGTLSGIDGSTIDYLSPSVEHPRGLLATAGVEHQQLVDLLHSLKL